MEWPHSPSDLNSIKPSEDGVNLKRKSDATDESDDELPVAKVTHVLDHGVVADESKVPRRLEPSLDSDEEAEVAGPSDVQGTVSFETTSPTILALTVE
jgi:hypothetical protein